MGLRLGHIIVQTLETDIPQYANLNVGNIRETFFFNQMRVKSDIVSSKKADFIIGNYTFEIGGKNKQQKQIEKDGQSFVVKDEIEFGYRNVIPLWAFGTNY